MERQSINALLPLNGVDPNYRCLAGEFDGCDNCVELGHIEIALELFARLPILDEQQGLALVEIRIEPRIEAARRDPRWSEHGSERTQQGRAPFIGSYDLHREDDQDWYLSVVIWND